MKVTLFALNGSYSHTNLAVRAIGYALRKSGVTTTITEKNRKDAHHSVLRALYEENADVYGFSVYIWNAEDMFRIAAELRQIRPTARIVFGGPEVSFAEESFLERHPFVDHIIAGEGEDAFPQLCEMLAAGKEPPRIWMALPYHDFAESGIYYDEIGDVPHGLVYYESARGCPFSCAYCLSSVTEGIRAKSAQKALDDLLRFEKFDDIRTVKLVDRTFNFDRARAKTIWRGLMEPCYTKEYHFEVSAALLDEESFALLSQAPKGKFRLEIGVQSTNPETIRAVSRALDTQKTLEALKRLMAPGNLHIHADLIAGLPHEDYDSFGRSFNDVYGLADVVQLGFLKLLHGSALRRDAEKLGIRYSPMPPYQVLETEALSYAALARLEQIEAVLERYSNSGKFARSFPFLPMACGAPFAFFEGLADYIAAHATSGEISKLPQTEVFALLLAYVREVAPRLSDEARERLALDYLLGETRRLPSFLQGKPLSDEVRTAMLAAVSPERRAGCEAMVFHFLGDHPVVVDRIRREILFPGIT